MYACVRVYMRKCIYACMRVYVRVCILCVWDSQRYVCVLVYVCVCLTNIYVNACVCV
jgi:hypothetical protein